MRIEGFEQALREDEFGVGDSFWMGNWEFQVVNSRGLGKVVRSNDVVFRWELTRGDFVQMIANNCPQIKYPAVFFSRHRREIMFRLRKGLGGLVSEYGSASRTVMNAVIEEMLGELERRALNRLVTGGGARAGRGRWDGEGSYSPSSVFVLRYAERGGCGVE